MAVLAILAICSNDNNSSSNSSSSGCDNSGCLYMGPSGNSSRSDDCGCCGEEEKSGEPVKHRCAECKKTIGMSK